MATMDSIACVQILITDRVAYVRQIEPNFAQRQAETKTSFSTASIDGIKTTQIRSILHHASSRKVDDTFNTV